jgi:hypothetical protein
MYFPYQAQPAPERTKAETEEYARQAVLTKKKVMGVHGPCVLSLVEDYDFILACYIDYMHGGCLGVGKSQLHIWTDPKHSSQPWSIRSLLPIIDAELQSIRPPTTVNRTPRSISDHLSFWKASEFRNWILFYSVPILRDRLPNPYFRHWSDIHSQVLEKKKKLSIILGVVLCLDFIFFYWTRYHRSFLMLPTNFLSSFTLNKRFFMGNSFAILMFTI